MMSLFMTPIQSIFSPRINHTASLCWHQLTAALESPVFKIRGRAFGAAFDSCMCHAHRRGR